MKIKDRARKFVALLLTGLMLTFVCIVLDSLFFAMLAGFLMGLAFSYLD